MKRLVNRRLAGVATITTLALALAACGQDANGKTDTTSEPEKTSEAEGTDETTDAEGGNEGAALAGQLAGAGASSMEKGQNAWMAEFMNKHSGLTISYDPSGSGNGRNAFISGSVQFAGSDSVMKPEEVADATDRCFGAEPIEVPLWISPIAIVFNLPGIDSLNMSAETVAKIFSGEIKNWNDPAIADANPGVDLPDGTIVPVNRSDKSGTTKNFTDYLAKAAPNAWTHDADEVWPYDGTQSGSGTSGVLEVVNGAERTIAYVDASRAGDLGTVAVKVGESYVPFSAEAAAKIVDVSQPTDDATDLRLTIKLARDTEEEGVYPIVLVSYVIACSAYDTEQDAANVKGYLSYIASEEGQNLAAQADVGGTAPISDSLRERVNKALDTIAVK